MRDIRIGASQFENRSADKEYNLSVVEKLTALAVDRGAEIVSFHEACIPGYTFVRNYSKTQLLELSEFIPDGPSTRKLIETARRTKTVILAGLLEKDENDRVYNSYVCVNSDGLIAKHRKIHAFINKHLSNGAEYTVFELGGITYGILTCFDNNLIENVRITTLMGAEVIFMPHVTCCLPSPMPGRGLVDRKLWDERDRDPVALRQEFMGPKGRGWLMRWLPARAYENGVYAIFTNPVGVDDDQIRNGNSMVLDPYGEIVVECNTLGDDVVVGLCTPEKLANSPGRRYLRARRPELYEKLTERNPEAPVIDSGWGIIKED
ncbi:(R)-stereoselective amidase [subsurface metagenome]